MIFLPSQPRRVCPNKGHSLETPPTAHGPGSPERTSARNKLNKLSANGKKVLILKKKHLDFIKCCLVIDNLSFIIYNLRSIFAWLNHSNSNTAMWVLWGTFPYEASYIKYLYLYLPVYLPIYLIKLSDQVLDGVGNMFGGWWWGDGVEGWQMA